MTKTTAAVVVFVALLAVVAGLYAAGPKDKKHPGGYYREGADGKRRYEITFLNEHGRRQWLTVDGNLEAAQAALDERKRRKRSGEPVAPEKVRLRDFADGWLKAQTQLRP